MRALNTEEVNIVKNIIVKYLPVLEQPLSNESQITDYYVEMGNENARKSEKEERLRLRLVLAYDLIDLVRDKTIATTFITVLIAEVRNKEIVTKVYCDLKGFNHNLPEILNNDEDMQIIKSICAA